MLQLLLYNPGTEKKLQMYAHDLECIRCDLNKNRNFYAPLLITKNGPIPGGLNMKKYTCTVFAWQF